MLGGAESLAADFARCLSKEYDVEVLTTCAKDYVTWKNEFTEGVSKEDGFTVRRFMVDAPRHPLFKPYNLIVKNLPHTSSMEKRWMRMQGPYSTSLIDHVKKHRDDYSLFIIVTYLYCTAYYCMPLVKEKAVLVPTAHDEKFIRFSIFRETFESARRLAYLTKEEQKLVESIFNVNGKGEAIGAPVSLSKGSPDEFRKKYGVEGDFILYAGRLDRMKGIGRLTGYFQRYVDDRKTGLRLVICGSGPMAMPESPAIINAGFVPDEDKAGAMMAALATCVPSPHESFSYSLLESLSYGTPVIANGECDVLSGHIERSGGGICFKDYESFATAIDLLIADGTARQRMGAAGREYALGRYSPAEIRKRYLSLVRGLINDER